MRITSYAAVVIAVALAYSTGATGQDKSRSGNADKPPAGPFQVKANVMVLDAANALVNDVTQQDVKVFEDGVEQKLTYFAKKDPVLNLALVVDNSGSLRTQLPSVMTAAATLITNLGDNDKVLIIRFISSDKIEIFEDWTSDKLEAIKAIRLMFVEGGQSAVIDAVYLAAEKLKERQASAGSNRYAVVLMSDCDDLNSYYNRAQLLDTIKETDIQIFPFALTSELDSRAGVIFPADRKGKAEKLANILAFRTGGHAYILDKKVTDKLLLENLRSLVIELRSQYVVGYTPINQARNSKRKLTVEIAGETKGQKRQGFIRAGIVVPKE